MLAAIAAGKVTRADINDYLKTIDVPGLTKQIKFDDKGEVDGEGDLRLQGEGRQDHARRTGRLTEHTTDQRERRRTGMPSGLPVARRCGP